MKDKDRHHAACQDPEPGIPARHGPDTCFRHTEDRQEHQQVSEGLSHVLTIVHAKEWLTHVFRIAVEVDDEAA